ncbi:MAG: flagellar export chaperone FlgN [Rhodospirillales bacterium]|nr:flagellar export chaperone FlgN [Alphaproteobacteria bacterium]MBL6947996.1 flagellar export chaperone FlgN [Rhodospirillales bacterium]
MDPTNRVNDLIVITKRLTGLLERENDALSNRKYSEINEILDEKVTLGRVYESRIMGLADDPTALNEVDGELRDQLRTLGEKVNALIADNSQLLKIGIEANRRVVNMIAEAVKASVPSAGTYSATGSGALDQQAAAKSVAISIDHTL